MNLTKDFTLDDLIKSETASRLNISNIPSEEVIQNLTALAVNVLQPLWNEVGPYHVNSGYRGPELNKVIGGAPTSQHMLGQAADIEAPGMSNVDLANWIVENMDFDQVILEFYTPGKPSSGWVHVSWSTTKNRKSVLTASKTDGKTIYKTGIIA